MNSNVALCVGFLMLWKRQTGVAMGKITTEQIRCYDAFVNCNRASENMMHSFAFSECSQQAAHFVQQVSAFLKRKQLSSFVCSSWRVFGSSKKCGVMPHNPPTQPLFDCLFGFDVFYVVRYN